MNIKNTSFLLLMILVISYASAQEAMEELPMGPKIFFAEGSYDFGDISQGDLVEHVFKFENIGVEPLILTDVRTTCGCTAPQWPREPIPPGQSAELKVIFNSAGKMGIQNKVITIMSNSINNPKRIKITTNVLPKDS